MRRRVLGSLTGLLLIVWLVGCSAAREQPASPSSPVSDATVSSLSSPSPAPTADMDALYAEAERVLRRSFELEDRYMQGGNFEEYPPELSDVLADPYLSLSRSTFEYLKENRWRGAHGASLDLKVQPALGISVDGSELALAGCLDTRNSPLVDVDGNVVSGGAIFTPTYFFKHVDGTLKLFASFAGDRVDQCPLG